VKIVILGLSITSSWGNGHATTYRGLVRELAARGHEVLFLERNRHWYEQNRDLPDPSFCRVGIYESLDELATRHTRAVREADLVIVGSFVPEGIAAGEWVHDVARGRTAFYDIDTPVTLARLASGDLDYLSTALIPRYDLYLSFTGGPVLDKIEEELGSPCARALFCSVDPALYYPETRAPRWDLGYLGTYSKDRQPALDRLLVEPARRAPDLSMVVAGPQYPPELAWPEAVERITHLAPRDHREFYNSQRFTLSVTRADMVRIGWSPSVRLFEAAACGVPILTDPWPGLDDFFVPGEDIAVVESAEDSLRLLRSLPESERAAIGQRARGRVLAEHTSAHRAVELERYLAAL
jgi:spore maturation protein CgeB